MWYALLPTSARSAATPLPPPADVVEPPAVEPRRELRRSDRDDFDDCPSRRRHRPDRQPSSGVSRGLLIAGAILAVPVLFVMMCCGITMLSSGSKPDAKAKGQQPDDVVRVHDDFPANKEKVTEVTPTELCGNAKLLRKPVRLKGRAKVVRTGDDIMLMFDSDEPGRAAGLAIVEPKNFGPIKPAIHDGHLFDVIIEGKATGFTPNAAFILGPTKPVQGAHVGPKRK